MWGKWRIHLQRHTSLYTGSQAATRDVAEAYCTIPLHALQWPAAVVRTSKTHMCIDTCAVFSAFPSSGAYGLVTDAGAKILCTHGIGPLN